MKVRYGNHHKRHVQWMRSTVPSMSCSSVTTCNLCQKPIQSLSNCPCALALCVYMYFHYHMHVHVHTPTCCIYPYPHLLPLSLSHRHLLPPSPPPTLTFTHHHNKRTHTMYIHVHTHTNSSIIGRDMAQFKRNLFQFITAMPVVRECSLSLPHPGGHQSGAQHHSQILTFL